MAFPTIPTVAAGRLLSNTQANGTAVRTFPSLSGLTKNSGDLLIAVCVVYQSSAAGGAVFSSWGAGFTEFLDVGGTTSNMSIGAAYKVSDGTETGTFTVTQAATVTGHAAMFLLSIPGAHTGIAPAGGTIVNGTAAAANIAALNPSTWGTLDTLWIAVGGCGETNATGAFQGLDAPPTNYTGNLETGISGDVVGGVEAGIGFRQLNAASDDPGTFAVDLSNARNSAVLLAVCPAPTFVTIAQAEELNSPQALAAAPTTTHRDITLASETDAVGEIVPLQSLPAAETDFVPQISTQSGYNLTTATETDSAQALDVDKAVTVTLASETDVVLSFGGNVVTLAAETDSAQPLTIAFSTYDITLVTETDLAGDVVEFQPLPALTTDSPQALSVTQSGLVLTPATETDSAQLLGFTQGGGYSIAPASETDLANTIVSLQPLPATTTASVQALDYIYGGKNIAPALETDSARSIAPGAGVSLPEWETSVPIPYNTQPAVGDVSTAVALSVTSGVGGNKSILPATETDAAGGSGPELLPNGGFELGFANWDTFGTMSAQARTYAQTPWVPVLAGTSLIQVEANANNDGIVTEPDEWIVVLPSTEYTLSAWFYAEVPFNPNIAWNEYTASDTLVAGSATGSLIPAFTWTQISFRQTTSATTEQLEVLISLPTGAPVEFWIDSISLSLSGSGALTIAKRVPLTMVTTTASAQALTKSKSYNITTASSTASALNLTYVQTSGTFYSIDAAVSTDTAVAISILKEIFMTLGIVDTTNIARFTRAANRPTGGLALVDHDPDSGIALTDHPETSDLALIDV